MRRPHLVVLTGLPGTGKSTIAALAARRLRAALLVVDNIEASLWRAGVSRKEPTGLAAYVIAQAAAESSLGAGSSVVADAVNSVSDAREGWQQAAERTQSVLRVVEVVCSDPDEHRRRIQSRCVDSDYPDPGGWQQVSSRRFEPWALPQSRLVLDTARMTESECERALYRYLPTGGD
jgi:predicted kinase